MTPVKKQENRCHKSTFFPRTPPPAPRHACVKIELYSYRRRRKRFQFKLNACEPCRGAAVLEEATQFSKRLASAEKRIKDLKKATDGASTRTDPEDHADPPCQLSTRAQP